MVSKMSNIQTTDVDVSNMEISSDDQCVKKQTDGGTRTKSFLYSTPYPCPPTTQRQLTPKKWMHYAKMLFSKAFLNKSPEILSQLDSLTDQQVQLLMSQQLYNKSWQSELSLYCTPFADAAEALSDYYAQQTSIRKLGQEGANTIIENDINVNVHGIVACSSFEITSDSEVYALPQDYNPSPWDTDCVRNIALTMVKRIITLAQKWEKLSNQPLPVIYDPRPKIEGIFPCQGCWSLKNHESKHSVTVNTGDKLSQSWCSPRPGGCSSPIPCCTPGEVIPQIPQIPQICIPRSKSLPPLNIPTPCSQFESALSPRPICKEKFTHEAYPVNACKECEAVILPLTCEREVKQDIDTNGVSCVEIKNQMTLNDVNSLDFTLGPDGVLASKGKCTISQTSIINTAGSSQLGMVMNSCFLLHAPNPTLETFVSHASQSSAAVTMPEPKQPPDNVNMWLIVGGVIGGIVVITLAALGIFLGRIHKQK